MQADRRASASCPVGTPPGTICTTVSAPNDGMSWLFDEGSISPGFTPIGSGGNGTGGGPGCYYALAIRVVRPQVNRPSL
jgi:hypothetical protein